MPNTFYEIKNKADRVRRINLISVLKLIGCVQDKYDKAKWHTPQGTISAHGPKFMNWTKGVGGAGAIDLVIHLKNLDFKSAVLWLADSFPTCNDKKFTQITPPSKQPFQVPQNNISKLPQVLDYLSKVRCIPVQFVKLLVNSGKLYADDRANAVFLLLGKEKNIVGAELHGTTHVHWKGMAPGSRKQLGCFFVKHSYTRKMILCESAIDAVSALVLYPMYLAVSTSGVIPNPPWLKYFCHHGYEIYCGFDSDDPGEKAAKKMMALYPTVKRLKPAKHDWNDVLIAKSKT